MTVLEVILCGVLGLFAGTVGGLAGIGGSLIILPGLALLLGYRDPAQSEQHMYMAAAMWINILVAVPAALRHRQAGQSRWDLVKVILPAMLIGMVVGVLLSNKVEGLRLRQGLAVFIAIYCLLNIWRALKPVREETRPKERIDKARLSFCGSSTGLISGLLGIGGGSVLIPQLQLMCKVRLKHAVATSLTVMPATAVVGASIKTGTLHTHDQPVYGALILIAAIGPMAILGGRLGAGLMHHLPLRVVRVIIAVVLLAAAVRMAGL
ncbi:MAG: sulfite exporter TauE/SafE family protein [Phycisphaerales bacterium]|nr:MAG: sulfite exporter TauE/SafE family protein [Phycisphaerales bacterium]